MKIVIAPDSFKESLSSLEVASEIEAGLKRVWPDATYVKVPMADGGEGTVQSLVDATGGEIVKVEVCGPLGAPVLASYGLLGNGKTAVIEMAEASGLPLVPRDQRDPLKATTFGTGQLIADAIDRGVEEIILGIGGSATNDGGAGLAQALGVRFVNFGGTIIPDLIAGGDLDKIQAVDMSTINPGLAKVRINVACDVTNPLCGETGASRVYGPQKGATPEMVEQLDSNLQHFAKVIKRSVGVDVADRAGAGAGGGIGAGLMAFTNATLKRGVELVVAATRLEQHMKGASLAFTGEGRVDFQTAFGKTPSGVANAAGKHGVPVIAIGGGLSDDARGIFEHGIAGLEAATANVMTLDTAIEKTRQNLQNAAERSARLIAIGQQMAK
ncbi:glycerate kinase [Hyphomicrobium sulfonivorans]|uniref:Glycerate kinase n=1 Tax=Hyphomicrobium sulfonivorans TaxID=121290 RepID=A0A109BE44_HYPSL|nr:glycerate kinase [Hyphomicrobium sulfonivorans]KWT67081.1 Glycerate kinase [Hyphomicrobium sulfonivorans]MBI1651291.1 glycerate kinase [Hyphomicrobium sulfonivorans]NSL73258.1 glycerate kinase [Hyphomicrobium sulfonivorans]